MFKGVQKELFMTYNVNLSTSIMNDNFQKNPIPTIVLFNNTTLQVMESYLMTKLVLSFLIAASSFQAFSALPPRFQGERDTKQIFSLLNESEYKNNAIGNFESLTKRNGQFELVYKIPYYNERCTLTFSRKEVVRAFGWVGPQEELEIKENPECITMK